MFIFNMKVNSKLIAKVIFITLLILVLLMMSIGVYKIFYKNTKKVDCSLGKSDINTIESKNYSSFLKKVHENLDSYTGTKIKCTGFVYRLYDFSDDQFVIGRQMIISSDMQAVIVGFLCKLNGAKKYEDGEWIEIEGVITKGEYHGEIPVIEIYNIHEINTPNDEYVYPPSTIF